MLRISREAGVKVAKHAWNVYPLEAFGFLLGRSNERAVYAALPCFKTSRWQEDEDRWNGVEENLDKARIVAGQFGLEVVGFYASGQCFSREDFNAYPPSLNMPDGSMGLFMLYVTMCCPGHSWPAYYLDRRWLKYGEDYLSPRGVRIDKSIVTTQVARQISPDRIQEKAAAADKKGHERAART